MLSLLSNHKALLINKAYFTNGMANIRIKLRVNGGFLFDYNAFLPLFIFGARH